MDHTESHRQLERALDALDTITTERGWGQPPLLLHVKGALGHAGDFDLGLRALDCHPAEALLGFSAPMAWTAIGVAAEGWATQAAETPHGELAKAPADASRDRVRTLVLLSHWGDPVGRVRWKDGRCLSEPPAEGFLLDCLRRAMVRPTSPPAASTTRLFATMWLENVVRQSRRGCRHLGWNAVVALHPAVQLLARNGQPADGDDLVVTARALGNVCDWSMVRQQVIRGWKVGLDAALAVWMDTGMLSRWLLDGRQDVGDLMGQLAARCSPSVLHRIRQTLTALEVIGAAPPHTGHPDVA